MLPRQRNRNVLLTASPIDIYRHARALEAQYTHALETIGRQAERIQALERAERDMRELLGYAVLTDKERKEWR